MPREAREAVVLVEADGVAIDGVDDNQTPAGERDGIQGTVQRVDQQLTALSVAVPRMGQGEAGEQDRGDAVGGSATDPPRNLSSTDDVGCEREVPQHWV